MAMDSEDGFIAICNRISSSYSLLSGSLCGIITIHDLYRRSSQSNTCPSVCKIGPATERAEWCVQTAVVPTRYGHVYKQWCR